jgi:hypothetical protein
MTAMVVSAQEVAEKTGGGCKASQFWDRPRHVPGGASGICAFGSGVFYVRLPRL